MSAALSDSHIIYSPTQPGEGWVSVGTGALGGKKWKYVWPPKKTEPTPAPFYRPTPPPEPPPREAAAPAPPTSTQPQAAPVEEPSALVKKMRETLARVLEAARIDLSAEAHPMNRLRGQMREYRIGGPDALPVKTILGTPEQPMTATDHRLMSAQHARLAMILHLNGKAEEAQAQLAATKYHNDWAKYKIGAEHAEQGRVANLEKQVPVAKPAAPPPRAKPLEDHLKSLEQSNVDDWDRPAVKETYLSALKLLPHAAKERAMRNVSGVRYYRNKQGVTHAWVTISGKPPGPGVLVGGFFRFDTGELVLDGATGDQEHERGVYLHEFGHAIDGGPKIPYGQWLSSSAEWNDAFSKELANGQLTEYGSRDVREGFAEFTRAVYSGKLSQEEMDKSFARCKKFFQAQGLLAGGAAQATSAAKTPSQAPKALPIEDKLPDPPKTIKTLKGETIKPPRVFYRATNVGGAPVKTGEEYWDNLMFASDNELSASSYGKNIRKIEAKPEANILYQGSKAFKELEKGIPKNVNMLTHSSEVAKRAKKLGYHAVWFTRQGDIGTAILDPSMFYDPDAVESDKKYRKSGYSE